MDVAEVDIHTTIERVYRCKGRGRGLEFEIVYA
jgi:hypothetical protein